MTVFDQAGPDHADPDSARSGIAQPDRAEALRRRLGALAFGGDYNPEQWPEPVWAEDARLMKEAGVNLVTVGVFSWAQVQPAAGVYAFGWFDRVLDLLAANGIAADVGTMTASPPPWLTHEYPEILPVRADGVVLSPGGRQHFNPSSPIYREHAAALVTRLAERYRDHPALALWHVGNEFGCHISASYDDVSAAAFRDWLRARYGDDVGELNEAWSTAFWSQRYSDFAQVLPPRLAASFPNPAQQLDFARFSDQAMLDCYRAELEILRRITPDVPVTTNFLFLNKPVDVQRWGPHLDVASVDCYPDPADPRAELTAGLTYDIVRSARAGQPWFLMEQALSAVNWRGVNVRKEPGRMRLWSWQAVAHGADAVLCFQWRQSRGGAEKFHSAMVPHYGPGGRVFAEARALGAELAAVPGLAGTRVANRAALLLDWESWWALELDSHPSAAVGQLGSLLHFYAPLFDAGIAVDVVHPDSDLSGYRLLIAPNLYLVRPQTGLRLDAWVRGGGHLVASFFSGIVDDCDRVHTGGYPGPLADLLGVAVEEFAPLDQSQGTQSPVVELVFEDGHRGTGSLWSEQIHLRGAVAVARFGAGDLAGRPAVTRNEHGAGAGWYLGTRPDESTTRRLIDIAAAQAGVAPELPGVPEGVQVSVREGAGQRYVLLLNHAAQPREVTLPRPLRVEVGADRGAALSELTLAPLDVVVLREIEE